MDENSRSPGEESTKVRPVLIGTAVVAGVLLIACLALGGMFMQKSGLLEAEIERTNSLQAQLTQEATSTAEIRSRLTATQAQLKSLAEEQTRAQVEKTRVQTEKANRGQAAQTVPDKDRAKLPPVPVRVTFDRSIFGRRLYGVFTNAGTTELMLNVQLTKPTGEQRNFPLKLAPGGHEEIDPREGLQFATGDAISVSSAGFDSVKLTVP